MTVPLMAAEHVREYTRGKLFQFSKTVTKTYPYRLKIYWHIDIKELSLFYQFDISLLKSTISFILKHNFMYLKQIPLNF